MRRCLLMYVTNRERQTTYGLHQDEKNAYKEGNSMSYRSNYAKALSVITAVVLVLVFVVRPVADLATHAHASPLAGAPPTDAHGVLHQAVPAPHSMATSTPTPTWTMTATFSPSP